jgi:hypothetical protein
MAETVGYSSNHLATFLPLCFLNELHSSDLAAVLRPVILTEIERFPRTDTQFGLPRSTIALEPSVDDIRPCEEVSVGMMTTPEYLVWVDQVW